IKTNLITITTNRTVLCSPISATLAALEAIDAVHFKALPTPLAELTTAFFKPLYAALAALVDILAVQTMAFLILLPIVLTACHNLVSPLLAIPSLSLKLLNIFLVAPAIAPIIAIGAANLLATMKPAKNVPAIFGCFAINLINGDTTAENAFIVEPSILMVSAVFSLKLLKNSRISFL